MSVSQRHETLRYRPQARERLGRLGRGCCTENHAIVVFQHREPVPEMGGVIFPDPRRDPRGRRSERLLSVPSIRRAGYDPAFAHDGGGDSKEAQKIAPQGHPPATDRRLSKILKLKFRPTSWNGRRRWH